MGNPQPDPLLSSLTLKEQKLEQEATGKAELSKRPIPSLEESIPTE
jgi:hypothetical protein